MAGTSEPSALANARGLGALGYSPGRDSDRWCVWFGTFVQRPRVPTQIRRAIDQANVAVGLRKIAQHAAGDRIDLLGQQADIVAAREQAIEQGLGFPAPALQYASYLAFA